MDEKPSLSHVENQTFQPSVVVPNAETMKAMKTARLGELVTVGSVENLLADLHAADQTDQPS
jgi:hypothetical protein